MSLKVEVKGFEKHIKKLNHLAEELDKALIEELNRAVKQWQKGARKDAAYDTGLLRKTYKSKKVLKDGNDFVLEVYNKTEYAMHYEYGHRLVRNKKTIGHVKGRYPVTKNRLLTLDKNVPLAFKRAIKKVTT